MKIALDQRPGYAAEPMNSPPKTTIAAEVRDDSWITASLPAKGCLKIMSNPQGRPESGPTPLVFDVDGAAAPGGATTARDPFDVLVEVVVDGEFLAFPNLAQAHVEDVAFEDPCAEIGVAGVIDVLRAAAAD